MCFVRQVVHVDVIIAIYLLFEDFRFMISHLEETSFP